MLLKENHTLAVQQEAWGYPAAEQAMEAPPYDLTELNSNTKLIEP